MNDVDCSFDFLILEYHKNHLVLWTLWIDKPAQATKDGWCIDTVLIDACQHAFTINDGCSMNPCFHHLFHDWCNTFLMVSNMHEQLHFNISPFRHNIV